MASDKHVDVLCIGAGVACLAAAKTYIQIAPETNLLIIDDKKTLGGVWSNNSVYPGLRTNNLCGTFELPDFPFPDSLGVARGEHIPGKAVHQYLVQYAMHFDVKHRIRYSTKALRVTKADPTRSSSSWRVDVQDAETGAEYTILADKLIVGTGLTSVPNKKHFKGEDAYDGPIIHAGSLGTEGPKISADPKIDRVTVIGGSKYAFDSAYTFATAGKTVDWIIQKSGYGPMWIPKMHAKLPLIGTVWAEHLANTRIVAWMSPCIFGGLDGSSWWRAFLHKTWLGRMIVAGFWKQMGHDMLEQAGYLDHPSLKTLIPDHDLFDTGTSIGALNYPTDLLDYVRSGQVTIHRQDVSHLSHNTVHLMSGTSLPSHALVSSSGWSWTPTLNFTDSSLHGSLGLPSTSYSSSETSHWLSLDSMSDTEISASLPTLASRPRPPLRHSALSSTDDPATVYTPQRLYRSIAPPSLSHNIAFAGYGTNISHLIKSHISSIWIYAYLNDLLPSLPTPQEAQRSISLFQRWAAKRHTYGYGERHVDYIWDAVPYNDLLLRDLGLEGRRKSAQGGWWWSRWYRECFESYKPEDYRTVVEEWIAKNHKALERQK